MNREVHVRFCEGLGVKFPWATRLFNFEAISQAQYTVFALLDLLQKMNLSFPNSLL